MFFKPVFWRHLSQRSLSGRNKQFEDFPKHFLPFFFHSMYQQNRLTTNNNNKNNCMTAARTKARNMSLSTSKNQNQEPVHFQKCLSQSSLISALQKVIYDGKCKIFGVEDKTSYLKTLQKIFHLDLCEALSIIVFPFYRPNNESWLINNNNHLLQPDPVLETQQWSRTGSDIFTCDFTLRHVKKYVCVRRSLSEWNAPGFTSWKVLRQRRRSIRRNSFVMQPPVCCHTARSSTNSSAPLQTKGMQTIVIFFPNRGNLLEG